MSIDDLDLAVAASLGEEVAVGAESNAKSFAIGSLIRGNDQLLSELRRHTSRKLSERSAILWKHRQGR